MNTASTIYVIYDGECPLCASYARMIRLREAVGEVDLLTARDPHPVVDEVLSSGHDLDEGMALKIGDQTYHGAECLHKLAMMSGASGISNRLHYWIFSSSRRAKTLYPYMVMGRNIILKLRGKKIINHPG